MDISVSDVGAVGLVKSIFNAGLTMSVAGVTLTWPEEFRSAASLMGLGAALIVVCAVIEWIFRSYHTEQADKISASNVALIQSGVSHLPYAREKLRLAETALADSKSILSIGDDVGIIINNDNGHLTTKVVDRATIEKVKCNWNDPNYDPVWNPMIPGKGNTHLKIRT